MEKNNFLRMPPGYVLGHCKIHIVPISEISSLLLTEKILISNQENLFFLDNEEYVTDHILLFPSVAWKLRIHLFIQPFLIILYISFQKLFCSRYWKRKSENDMFSRVEMTCSGGTSILVGIEGGKNRHETNK